MRTLLKGSKNLQNNGKSISKPQPSSLKPDPLPPENSLSSSHIRVSYPSSLIIPRTSSPPPPKMEPTAIKKQNSKPPKSNSQGPKSPEKRAIQPQSAPKQKVNFLDLTHEKKSNNSKNQVISLASTPEDQPGKQRGTSPGTHKRLDFGGDEVSSVKRFGRLKKLQNAGFQSPSSSFQKSGKTKIKELLKEKENRRGLKFKNEILRDLDGILENNEKYKVDLTVTGEDLNMEGHREETESVCSYDESTSSTREYCVYEDWKLIEAAEQYKRLTGNLKGLIEPRIWAEMIDLETNRTLLEDRRDSKSMAKRYGGYLIYLSPEVTQVIHGMAKELTLKELKRIKLAFKENKRGDGKKKLAYIYKDVKGKTERLSLETLKNFYEIAQEEKAFVVSSGEMESDEIEEVEIEEVIRPEVTGKSSVSEDISNFNDSQLSFSAARRKNRRLNENNPPDDIINVDDEEDALFKNNGTKKIKENNGKEVVMKDPLQERAPSTSCEEVNYPKKFQDEILKKRRKNWEYDKKSLIASKKFESRRGTRRFSFDPNLCLFVDMEHQFRQFVKTDNEVIIDEEEESDLVGNQLSEYALEYEYTLQEIGDLFKKASCNLKELEKYLRTKNVNILWNSQEDADLRENNQVALRYLVRTKGADRIKERRVYLKKVDRRHTNVIISD